MPAATDVSVYFATAGPTATLVTFWVNPASVARWTHIVVAAGVVALFCHVSDADDPASDAARPPGAAGTVR